MTVNIEQHIEHLRSVERGMPGKIQVIEVHIRWKHTPPAECQGERNFETKHVL